MSKQYTLTEKEKQELLNSRHQKQPYKMKGHQWKQLKGCREECMHLLWTNDAS